MKNITINEAKKAVSAAVKSYLYKENGDYAIDVVSRLPIYLEGPVGIGKTAIANQVASELEIGFKSYSLTHHTKNSLLGLPVIKDMRDGHKFTEYTLSEIIADVYKEVEKGYEEGILLLDEFPCMSEAIAPIMLAFLQTKNIGDFSLPDGWVIILCGNPSEYNRSAKDFDMATLDRVRKIKITSDVEDYLEYAKSNSVNKAVIDYLTINRRDYYKVIEDKRGAQGSCVTCRGWTDLSKSLSIYEKLSMTEMIDEEFIYQFIKDSEIAHRFYCYYSQVERELSIDEMERIINSDNPEELLFIMNRIGKLDFQNRWKIADTFINFITNKIIKLFEEKTGRSESEKGFYEEEIDEEIKQVGGRIMNKTYDFLDKIDFNDRLCKKFTDVISTNSLLLMIADAANIEHFNEMLIARYEVV